MANNLNLMKDGKMSKALIVFSLPSIIGVLISSVYNFTDALFVGKIGTSAVGATTIVYPLIALLPAIGLLFSNGASAHISKLLGADNKLEAEQVLVSSFLYSILASLTMQIIALVFLNPFLKLMGASTDIFPLAREYAVYVISGGILQVMVVSLANLVRSEGAVKLSMYSQVSGAVLNVILNPIFIFTFNLGLRGAAIATLISQFVSVLIMIQYYVFKKSYLKFSFKNVRFSKNIFVPVILIGLPIFTTLAFESLSIALLSRYASLYGDVTVAAIGIVIKICTIPTLAITGFSRGYQNVVSYNLGANNPDRVKEATKLAIKWSTLFLIIFSLLQILFSENLIRMFVKDVEVIKIGSKALKVNSLLLFTFGIQTINLVYLLCTGKSKSGLFLSLGRQGIFFIPTIIILNSWFNLNGIISTQAVSDLLTTLASLLMIWFWSKQTKTTL